MKNTLHAGTNYKKLLPYLGDMIKTCRTYKRFESSGYMPLVIEKLGYKDRHGNPVFSITHYGEMNGDLMSDPDITIAIDSQAGTVEPLTFRNDYMGVYQEVYFTDDAGRLCYHPKMRTGIDEFLWYWLDNIAAQGYAEA